LGIVSAQVIQDNPEELRRINIYEHLGDSIPLDLSFVDDHGDSVTLAHYFHQGRPVVLILGYYTCPMLCNLVMNGVSDVVKELPWQPGAEYQLLSVSIDTTETHVVAAAKKKNYLETMGRPEIGDGWALLTGTGDQAQQLADAVGFQYYYDETQKQYAHPAMLAMITEGGVISRYLYGIQYPERDFRLGLMDASEGKVGSTLDKILLYCYHYDPQSGSYTVLAGNVMRLGGGMTLAALGLLLGGLWVRDRKSRRSVNGSQKLSGRRI